MMHTAHVSNFFDSLHTMPAMESSKTGPGVSSAHGSVRRWSAMHKKATMPHPRMVVV